MAVVESHGCDFAPPAFMPFVHAREIDSPRVTEGTKHPHPLFSKRQTHLAYVGESPVFMSIVEGLVGSEHSLRRGFRIHRDARGLSVCVLRSSTLRGVYPQLVPTNS